MISPPGRFEMRGKRRGGNNLRIIADVARENCKIEGVRKAFGIDLRSDFGVGAGDMCIFTGERMQ